MCMLTTVLPSFATGFSKDVLPGLITQNFTNISLFQNGFDISANGMASVNSYLSAQGSDQLVIFCEIQCYTNGSWQSIKQWTVTGSGISLSLSRNYYVTKGKLYRMKTVGSVYKSGMLLEHTSFTSASVFY